MARTRQQETYDAARNNLLETGEKLFRQKSFAETGISDILKQAGIAKGSFYHYFESKEGFGIAVARRYSENQILSARTLLNECHKSKTERLRTFFSTAKSDMANRNFAEGCLMCNLTTELADEYPAFQQELRDNWNALANEISQCIDHEVRTYLGFAHLSETEAADWLLNAWSGALTRMKACGSAAPLELFIKTVFDRKTTE